MILFPNCKINIGLNVIRKRSDGFHDLESVFFPVPFHDVLEIIPAADGIFNFQSTGLPIPGEIDKNLCVTAFQLLQSEFKLPEVKIHLHKLIPIGAGLGGGSSDGAFTLKLLNIIFNLSLDDDQLKDYARVLGSDCPFFIENRPLFAYERGDHFEAVELNLSGLTLLLVLPGMHISTAEAYSAVVPAIPEKMLKESIHLPIEQWKEELVNDFEQPVFAKYPAIGEIKRKLYESGAIYASMSGSGSAVYGLFREKPNTKGFFQGNFTSSFIL
jgi:4-diphosphocytidyl-2-C-methyl-D-erythritol kinase